MRTAPFRSAGRPRIQMWARFTVGAAGVVALDTAFSDPGIALGNFSSGVAALTYPIASKAFIDVGYKRAAVADDSHVYLSAQDSTLGTASITSFDDGAAENPADGAVITVSIIAETRG